MKYIIIYIITLIIAPIAWIPFSYSNPPDFNMLWISGLILGLGSGFAFRHVLNIKKTSHLSYTMKKFRIVTFITLLFAIFLTLIGFISLGVKLLPI